MGQLNIQSDRNALDHDALDQEYAQRAEQFSSLAFGISFDGQKVHFAEVMRADAGFSVRKFGTIQTNMRFGTGIEGVERNVSGLYSYLNGCLEDNAITARRMNLSLNSNLVMLHRVLVEPESSDQDYEDYVKWEFSQQVLDETDNYVVNTANLEQSSQSKLNPILVVGVRRRYVESLTQVLEKCKIQFSNIDVDLLCTHATYELNYDLSYHGMTALVECRPGTIGVLLCKDYEIESIYEFTVSPKSPASKLGDLINQHLANALALYHQEVGNTNSILGRVILSNALAQEVLPFIDKAFDPSVIDPFKKIGLPEELRAKDEPAEESANTADGEAPKTPKASAPPPDYSPYAECIGAALKLLID